MKITVVGSGDIWSKSNSACYLIDEDIIIDMPNGTYKALSNLKLKHKKINYVLFTHFHGDHYFDIPFHFLNMCKSKNCFVNIYAFKEGFKKIKKLLKLAFPNSVMKINKNVEIKYIDKDSFYINDYFVSRVYVKHSFMNACGYIIDNGKVKVGFTGDARYSKGVIKLAKSCDYLICDCTYLKGNMKHMGIDDIIKLSTKYSNCKYICSHMADKTKLKLEKLKLK